MSIRITIPLLTSLLLLACGRATDLNTDRNESPFIGNGKNEQKGSPTEAQRILCHSGERPFLTAIGAQAGASDRGRTFFLKNFDSAQSAQIQNWDERNFQFFFLTKANAFDAPMKIILAKITPQNEQPLTEEIVSLTPNSEWNEIPEKWRNRGWNFRNYGLIGDQLWIRMSNTTSIRSIQNPKEELIRIPYPSFQAKKISGEKWFLVLKDNRLAWWNPDKRTEWNIGKPLRLIAHGNSMLWWEEAGENSFKILFSHQGNKAIQLNLETDSFDGDFIPPNNSENGVLLIRQKNVLQAWELNSSGKLSVLSLPSKQLQESGREIIQINKQLFFNYSQPSLPNGLYRWQPLARNGQRVGMVDCEKPEFFPNTF